jgi:CBS-domain-containing membrane protein
MVTSRPTTASLLSKPIVAELAELAVKTQRPQADIIEAIHSFSADPAHCLLVIEAIWLYSGAGVAVEVR